jgi:hypothetical protein
MINEEVTFEFGEKIKISDLTHIRKIKLSNGFTIDYKVCESPLDDLYNYCAFEIETKDCKNINKFGGKIIDNNKGFFYIGKVPKHLGWNKECSRIIDKIIDFKEF